MHAINSDGRKQFCGLCSITPQVSALGFLSTALFPHFVWSLSRVACASPYRRAIFYVYYVEKDDCVEIYSRTSLSCLSICWGVGEKLPTTTPEFYVRGVFFVGVLRQKDIRLNREGYLHFNISRHWKPIRSPSGMANKKKNWRRSRLTKEGYVKMEQLSSLIPNNIHVKSSTDRLDFASKENLFLEIHFSFFYK